VPSCLAPGSAWRLRTLAAALLAVAVPGGVATVAPQETGGVRFDDEAPLAAARHAITTPCHPTAPKGGNP